MRLCRAHDSPQQGKSKNGRIRRKASRGDLTIGPQILRTKLPRPLVAPDILPRARLLERLKEGFQRTLTLISAPAGYGKSTLASRWVSACEFPTGWVSLDENDSDVRTFLGYVLAAIRSIFPETELRAESLLEASPLPSASVVAHYLVNDLFQVTEPFILVDDATAALLEEKTEGWGDGTAAGRPLPA